MGLILGSGSSRPTFPYNKYYGIKMASHATSTSQSFTAVNSDLMEDSAFPIWTRIRSFVENNDGTVNYYLDKMDSRYKQGGTELADLTGADGNVMVEIPEHYMRQEWVDGDYYRLYSDYPLPGFTKVPRRVLGKFMATQYTGATSTGALVQNGLVSNSLLTWSNPTYMEVSPGDSVVGKFATKQITIGETTVDIPSFDSRSTLAQACRGGSGSSDSGWDDTYHSMLGMCRTSVSRTNYRSWCNNVNTAHSITDADKILHVGYFHIYNELAWLMRTKIKDYDIQNSSSNPNWGGSAAILDSTTWSNWGSYRPFIPNGMTAPLGDRSGYVTYNITKSDGTTQSVKCKSLFGVEMPTEYIWQVTDDLLEYNNGTKSKAYWCNDPTKYSTPADTAAETWADSNDYEYLCELPMTAGYVKRESILDNGMSLPQSIGIGQVGDYYYPGSGTGWYGSFFGGSAADGADAGFGFLYAHYRPAFAHADVGARLCRN